MLRSRIIGTGAYAPLKVLSNFDLEKMVNTSDEWIMERTGIRERRVAAEDEATSDLSVKAANNAIEMANIKPEAIDIIIVGTVTPDMFFPSTASIVQNKIGAKNAVAFDISAACSGFIYALSIADQFIKSGTYKTALVIGAEVLSRMIDWTDRNTCVLFGDGAGAVILKAENGERGVLSAHLHTDGSMWELLYTPGGGSRHPISHQVIDDRLIYMKMKGNETFKVAVKSLESVVVEALEYNNLKPSDIRWVIPHQANLRIIQSIVKRLEIPIEKVVLNIEKYGNTSAASVPMALDEAVRDGRVKKNDIIIFEAFGAGLTWASALVRW
ncbi:MAG: ketoacyl-ACP synthase III [Nitrospirae bacterium]|nr:ketoacyl-ACP synthase III [Nitrospirota bacterium]